MSQGTYITRQEFLHRVEEICIKEGLSFAGINITINFPEKIVTGSYKPEKIPFTELFNKLAPVLTEYGVTNEEEFVQRLNIIYFAGQRQKYIPKEKGELPKFPTNKKITTYFESYLINVQDLYDKIIINTTVPTLKIYRLETLAGEGFYSTKVFKGYGNTDLHPPPMYDPKFYNLFADNYPYKLYAWNWYFGWASIEDANTWINGTNGETYDAYESLSGRTYFKEITVPEAFVIKGHKQVIFQAQHIVNEQIIDYGLLNPEYIPEYVDEISLMEDINY